MKSEDRSLLDAGEDTATSRSQVLVLSEEGPMSQVGLDLNDHERVYTSKNHSKTEVLALLDL